MESACRHAGPRGSWTGYRVDTLVPSGRRRRRGAPRWWSVASSAPRLGSSESLPFTVTVSGPYTPTLSIAVRDLPDEPDLPTLDREPAQRDNRGFIGPDIQMPPHGNPLADLQRNAPAAQSRMPLGRRILNFAGIQDNSSPPDDTGDVGLNHYLQGDNGPNGSRVTIYDKTGVQVDQFDMEDLASTAPCNSGYCDPIIQYDELANRWMVAEFDSSANTLCVYVSQTSDPTGQWYAYAFDPPGGHAGLSQVRRVAGRLLHQRQQRRDGHRPGARRHDQRPAGHHADVQHRRAARVWLPADHAGHPGRPGGAGRLTRLLPAAARHRDPRRHLPGLRPDGDVGAARGLDDPGEFVPDVAPRHPAYRLGPNPVRDGQRLELHVRSLGRRKCWTRSGSRCTTRCSTATLAPTRRWWAVLRKTWMGRTMRRCTGLRSGARHLVRGAG